MFLEAREAAAQGQYHLRTFPASRIHLYTEQLTWGCSSCLSKFKARGGHAAARCLVAKLADHTNAHLPLHNPPTYPYRNEFPELRRMTSLLVSSIRQLFSSRNVSLNKQRSYEARCSWRSCSSGRLTISNFPGLDSPLLRRAIPRRLLGPLNPPSTQWNPVCTGRLSLIDSRVSCDSFFPRYCCLQVSGGL